MEELVKLLSEELRYEKHNQRDDYIDIYVRSARKTARCPYCEYMSEKVYSKATRTLKDLPIQGKKVKLILSSHKYFCKNANCNHKTFVERFEFFEPKATKTKRLQAEILRVSLTQSSVAAARYLRTSVADVSKSTICDLLKKGREK